MNLIPAFTVEMDIHNLLYISYIVPVERLRHMVANNIRLIAPSPGKAVISLVMFQSRNVKASFLPFIRFSYYQANIRTYIIDPLTEKNAVYFLKSGITSRFVSFVTNLLRIPWQSISASLNTAYNKEDESSRFTVKGHWKDDFTIDLQATQNATVNPEPFNTTQEAVHFLTGPTVGLYKTSGGFIRFDVKHSDIKPSTGTISAMRFPLLLRSGFVLDGELLKPQSILIAPDGHFTIYMPPTRLFL